MAIMPRASFSADRLINIGRRFVRLCTRDGAGVQKFIDAVSSALESLSQKSGDYSNAAFDRDTAVDVSGQADYLLDSAVKTAFERCGQHDRDNHSRIVQEKAFSGKKFTPITHAPRHEEIGLVRQVVNRIRELGPESGVSDVAENLENAIAMSEKAKIDLAQKQREFDDAKTLEQIERARFVETYASTYHDMCSELGKVRADSLFPKIGNRNPVRSTPDKEGDVTATSDNE